MATYVSGVYRPDGPLAVATKSLLLQQPAVVAEFDGWHTATALVLYHLSDCDYRNVLIVSSKRPSFFRLKPGWRVQEAGLLSPICRGTSALWLGPPESAPLGATVVWPAFAGNLTSPGKCDYGVIFHPEYLDYPNPSLQL
jgi:hypothetical protein